MEPCCWVLARSSARKRGRRVHRYTPYHAYLLTLVTTIAFAFMAGQYPYWLQHTLDEVPQPDAAVRAGPRSLVEWGSLGLGANDWRSFSGFYLVRPKHALCACARRVACVQLACQRSSGSGKMVAGGAT